MSSGLPGGAPSPERQWISNLCHQNHLEVVKTAAGPAYKCQKNGVGPIIYLLTALRWSDTALLGTHTLRTTAQNDTKNKENEEH